MLKILLIALQRNIRHFDRLLDDLKMGSLKKIPSSNVGFERFFSADGVVRDRSISTIKNIQQLRSYISKGKDYNPWTGK